MTEQHPNQITLLKFVMSKSDGSNPVKLDTDMIISFDFMESIVSPMLSGQVVVSDSKDFINQFPIEGGEIVEVDFNFTNSGKSDLIIFDASASCGCTVPEYPQNVNIKPGQSDKLKVRFDTANKPGKQIKSVTLTTNTNSGKKIIRISGFVLNK